MFKIKLGLTVLAELLVLKKINAIRFCTNPQFREKHRADLPNPF